MPHMGAMDDWMMMMMMFSSIFPVQFDQGETSCASM